MQGAVASAYLLILCFSWVFMGTSVTVNIRGKAKKILRPFSRLRSIVVCYVTIFVLSLGFFLIGTIWVATPGASSSPLLFWFSCFAIAFYWVMIIILGISIIQIKKNGNQNKNSSSSGKDATKGAKYLAKDEKSSKSDLLENSEEWFNQKFEDESDGTGDTIESDKLGKLIASLGIVMTETEISAVTDLLDTEGTGDINRHDILMWFNKTGKIKKNEMVVDEEVGSEGE